MHLCAGVDPVLPKRHFAVKMNCSLGLYSEQCGMEFDFTEGISRHHRHHVYCTVGIMNTSHKHHRHQWSRTPVATGVGHHGQQSLRAPVVTDTSHYGHQSSRTPVITDISRHGHHPSRTSQTPKYHCHKRHHIHLGRYGQLCFFDILCKTF